MEQKITRKLPYIPSQTKREFARYYIPASDSEIQEMLKKIGFSHIDDLFAHIPKTIRQNPKTEWNRDMEYEELLKHMEDLAQKNNIYPSFIGDGLPHFEIDEIVPLVLQIRGLTTAYTPYQPERGQGTLIGQWIYTSLMSMLTGFEAINASLYDRATALFEALNCARKLKKGGGKTVLVCDGIYPGDKEVLNTLIQDVDFHIDYIPQNTTTGMVDLDKLRQRALDLGAELSAIAFPQVNHFGIVEDVDALTDFCHEIGVKSVAVIDPILLGKGGLKAPSTYGSKNLGVDLIVGEGQHLASSPGFGGPGLGIFGVRYNEKDKNSIRQAPGRFISRALDIKGRDCKTLVLSTREQHIRREKATSNICSNQAFMATLAGAALLGKGDAGMEKTLTRAQATMKHLVDELTRFKGVELAFPDSPIFNEFTLKLPIKAIDAINLGRQQKIHIGVDVSKRHLSSTTHTTLGFNLLKISCSDHQSDSDIDLLLTTFAKIFGEAGPKSSHSLPPIISRREAGHHSAPSIPHFTTAELNSYYQQLGKQNVSPDDQIYALGSCTMKYNPFINEYAAGLPGFTELHPQVPVEDAQGCLHILYQVQEIFTKMLGLSGLTTQPLAGAQGEHVGLKLFQGYHRSRGEGKQRDTMLIPHSAHGTNPASASAAGFKNIVEINADETGQVDLTHLKSLIAEYGQRVAGIMVTNPNTSGIFEARFKELADMVHAVGGLVYMDGANLNAIAGIVHLGSMGVDAVHSNLHKTWSIPHGGGGPGDGIVAVSEKLIDFLPGYQIEKSGEGEKATYYLRKPIHSIGSFHRHYGNFLHKVRCYTYLQALGTPGTKKMSQIAVLSSAYLHHHLKDLFPTLPAGSDQSPRMHEFIMTLSSEMFEKIEKTGLGKAEIIPKIGKLFLDFGLHAPTVAFPEVYGLMVEPTESFTRPELDRFIEIVKSIHYLINERPEVLKTAPHFTPISKIDEVGANKTPCFSETLKELPQIYPHLIDVEKLHQMDVPTIAQKIIEQHQLLSK